MSKTAYVGILIFYFMCLVVACMVWGIQFSNYCFEIAKKEGAIERLEELGAPDAEFNEYQSDIFYSLYDKDLDGEDIENFRVRSGLRKRFHYTSLALVVFVLLLVYLK